MTFFWVLAGISVLILSLSGGLAILINAFNRNEEKHVIPNDSIHPTIEELYALTAVLPPYPPSALDAAVKQYIDSTSAATTKE